MFGLTNNPFADDALRHDWQPWEADQTCEYCHEMRRPETFDLPDPGPCKGPMDYEECLHIWQRIETLQGPTTQCGLCYDSTNGLEALPTHDAMGATWLTYWYDDRPRAFLMASGEVAHIPDGYKPLGREHPRQRKDRHVVVGPTPDESEVERLARRRAAGTDGMSALDRQDSRRRDALSRLPAGHVGSMLAGRERGMDALLALAALRETLA